MASSSANRKHYGNGSLEQYNIAIILLKCEPKFLQHVKYITSIVFFYKQMCCKNRLVTSPATAKSKCKSKSTILKSKSTLSGQVQVRVRVQVQYGKTYVQAFL